MEYSRIGPWASNLRIGPWAFAWGGAYMRGNTVPISAIHNYETRSAVAGKLAQPHIFNTKIHGNKMFKRQGVLIFNEIVSKEFYINPTTKMSFLKKFKEYLIGLY